MDKEKTGMLIEQLRKEQGLTQKQLAERLHISDRTVSKWERGVGFPDISLLEPLANALNVSIVSLIQGQPILEQTREESIRGAISTIYRWTKQKLLKNLISIIATAVLCAGFIWFVWAMLEYNGAFLKDVSLTVPVVVYKDGQAVENSTVTIEGTRAKDSFAGTFAIDFVEKTTRDNVQGYVEWGTESWEYDTLRFFAYGGFWDCGIDSQIYISESMMRMAMQLEDGTIIATDEALMELMALDSYYPLDF